MQNEKFNKAWLAIFGKQLTKSQIEQASIGQDDGFLWHAFSYGYLPCLEGDDARKAYDSADKTGANMAFYEIDHTGNTNQFTIVDQIAINENFFTADQIDKSDKVEVYVIDQNEKWCYIRTHETMCGPYFCFASED